MEYFILGVALIFAIVMFCFLRDVDQDDLD